MTGNQELSKEALPKNVNFLSENEVGVVFLKKIMKKVNFIESIENIEERFLPDGDKDFLIKILTSL